MEKGRREEVEGLREERGDEREKKRRKGSKQEVRGERGKKEQGKKGGGR